jgi:hypothetical protein
MASRFLIGIGAGVAALLKSIVNLLAGVLRLLVSLVSMIVAAAWVMVRGLFGRRDQ